MKKIKSDLVNYAKTSWGKEWIHSMLKIGRPYRMQRGINYAKDEKRIENISITKGQLFATVQGTAPTPYRVKINFKTIPKEGWKKIIKELSTKTINLIELLNGNLPEDIINIFKENNFSLFLDAEADKLDASCSCPDQAIPCKHIAALILYVACVLDYNPFILLELRGKQKNELLNDLRLAQTSESVSIPKETSKTKEGIEFSFNIPKIQVADIPSESTMKSSDFKIGFQFKKPGKIIETLENLGHLPNLDDPLAFETVFKGIYRTTISEIYKSATSYKEPRK